MAGGVLDIPGNASHTGEGATISHLIGHVVAVCGCPARIVLLFSLGPEKVKCPMCGIERSIKRFKYELVEGPNGLAAEIDVELNEPVIKSPIMGNFGKPGSGFQS